ncbi:MAG: GNAT family N-acetyltransferase [Armatimonadota bacterium]|jgi:ribosomal protein S18 acetylase RimI-like enzyme
MDVRAATIDDASVVAAEHPLPREGQARDRLYRRYYLLKTLLYTRAPMAGVATGWIDDEMAGFVFYCEDMARFRRFMRSARSLAWICGVVLRGWFGWEVGFWGEALQWCRQHFHRVRADDEGPSPAKDTADEITSWVGTVHTVASFRRLGVASHLLTAVEDHLAERGDGKVALWVASDNEPAQSLYYKRGYVRVNRVPRIGEECWLMVKRMRPGVASEE